MDAPLETSTASLSMATATTTTTGIPAALPTPAPSTLNYITNNNNNNNNNNADLEYCPPEYFGIVEPLIYRSNMFNGNNFQYLKTLGLKSVLWLGNEQPTREVNQFLDENGIKLLHIASSLNSTNAHHPLSSTTANISGNGVGMNTTWRPISEELVKESLETMLNADNHPILICCALGIHETGTLVGCLRKLLGWNMNSIAVEYRSFAGNRARYINEQYIELFDLDLITLPGNLPSWFLQYCQCT